MTDPKAHPLIFSAPMILAALDGRKRQTRRVVTPRNSLIDGSGQGIKAHWEHLDWSKAWVDSGPSPVGNPGPYWKVPCNCTGVPGDVVHRVYPRYQVGDWVWGKETWWHYEHPDKRDRVAYDADDHGEDNVGLTPLGLWRVRKRSPIYMPRAFSRFERPIVRVGAERVQSISPEDCFAEGLPRNDDNEPPIDWPLDDDAWCPTCQGEGLVGCVVDGAVGETECTDCDTPVKCFSNYWDSINGNKPGRDWASNPPVYVVEWGTE